MPYTTRVKMQVLHEEGCSYRQIATCRNTTARMIINRFQLSGSLKDKPRSRRPRCGTTRDDRVLLRLCRADRKKTAPELKRQWSEQLGGPVYNQNCSWATFETWFKSCIARKKSLITEKQRRARRLWSEEHRQWTKTHWAKIIWSDESSFQIYPSKPNKCPKETWGRICTCLHCCNCETWRRKQNGLGMHECWRCWTANRL